MAAKKLKLVFCFKQKSFFTFQKNGPQDFVYGLSQVRKNHKTKTIFAGRYQFRHLVFQIWEKILAQQLKLGIYFQIYLNNKQQLKNNDLLFAVNDGVGLGLLFFKLLGQLDNKIVVLIQGLHDRYQYLQNRPLLFNFYQKMLKQAELILTLSSFEKNLLQKQFRLNSDKMGVFQFGVDLNFWQHKKAKIQTKKQNYALSLGNDMHRDYLLLMENYHIKTPLKIVSRIIKKQDVMQEKKKYNLHHLQKVSNHKLRQLYGGAKFIIIPLKKHTLATSGLSVLLQSWAMKKPVLLAATPAMKSLFKNKKHVLFYQPDNINSFKKALQKIDKNNNLRKKISQEGYKLVKEKHHLKSMAATFLTHLKNHRSLCLQEV